MQFRCIYFVISFDCFDIYSKLSIISFEIDKREKKSKTFAFYYIDGNDFANAMDDDDDDAEFKQRNCIGSKSSGNNISWAFAGHSAVRLHSNHVNVMFSFKFLFQSCCCCRFFRSGCYSFCSSFFLNSLIYSYSLGYHVELYLLHL